MTWILVFVVTSVWDGRPVEFDQIAEFKQQAACEELAVRMNEDFNSKYFVCLPQSRVED